MKESRGKKLRFLEWFGYRFWEEKVSEIGMLKGLDSWKGKEGWNERVGMKILIGIPRMLKEKSMIILR